MSLKHEYFSVLGSFSQFILFTYLYCMGSKPTNARQNKKHE